MTNRENLDKRVIGLDLLRAYAITAVITVHVTSLFFLTDLVGNIPNGVLLLIPSQAFISVEMLFALSGFLIGRLLLEILEKGPTFRNWYVFVVRRWMRTVPLYAVWILVLLVFFTPEHAVSTTLQYLFFVQNFAWPMPANHWFSVSWSLAVEEWFYLLFSATLIPLALIGRRTAIIVACGLFLLVPLVLRLYFAYDQAGWDEGARKVMLFRLDAIAYGVVMAYAYRYWYDKVFLARHYLAIIGLGLVILPWLVSTDPSMDMWWLSAVFILTSCGCALILPWAAEVRALPGIVQPLVHWLATRSYCLYVSHLTLLFLALDYVNRGQLPTYMALVLSLGACCVLTELSFRFLETPILRRRPRQFIGSKTVEPDMLMRGVPGVIASSLASPGGRVTSPDAAPATPSA
jgi:peptidoglycan/LPS O-acetylase OafA/YrhL